MLSDLVDLPQIQNLSEAHYKAAGMPIGLIDAETGAILIGAGWQDICVRFHRSHPLSEKRCRESDSYIKGRILDGKPCAYKCRNGLWDIGIPILVDGRHLATLFLGQFFYEGEEPDRNFFILQAKEFGYDVSAYLDALDRVPVFSRGKVDNILDYNVAFAKFIADLAYKKQLLNMELEERERMEAALRESEEKFLKAFHAAPSVLVISTIADGRYIEVNESFERVTGFRREEAVGRTSLELNIWETRKARARFVQAMQEKGKVRDLEEKFRTKKGEILVGLVSAEIIEIKGQRCLLTLVSDITERKRAEEALCKSEQKFRAIFDQTFQFIGLLTLDGTLIGANRTALGFCGVEEPDVMGKPFWETPWWRHSIELQEKLREAVKKAAQGEFVRFESTHPASDGSLRYFDFSLKPILDEAGNVVLLIPEGRDITERKRAEEALNRTHTALKERTVELEVANKELEAFSYMVSNHLRAPLRRIEGFTEAIIEDYAGKLDETGKDYFVRVISASRRMSQLIDALLTMSHLIHRDLCERTVDLSQIVGVIAYELRKKEPGRDAEFIIAGKVKVQGDAEMLRVVMENLLHNAWKFTSKHPSAGIEFGKIKNEGPSRADGIEKSVYFVRDNGVGFDMKCADKLFLPFRRLHSESEFPGLGIGLSIAQQIINKHGGRMWAESEEGKGATFFFSLP